MNFITSGERPPRVDTIPDHYRELIDLCWKGNHEERLKFSDIVEYLKKDEFAIEAFGQKTDLEQLHEYQQRIDKENKEENIEMKRKVEEYESILLPQRICNENVFIGEEDEEFFEKVGIIGEGATSVTYKVIDNRNKTPLCKKVIKYRKDQTTIKDAQNVLKEFQVLHDLSHPCICKAIGINMSEPLYILIDGENKELTTIALYLEFLEYDLNDFLKMKINNTMKTRIVVDIVHAMNFLHKKGIMHRDLKIENIMLNSVFETKLVDFGLVKINENALDHYSFVQESLTKGIGTFAYMSPEMINEEEYDFKTDVYSFGVVLYFMFVGSLPKQSIKDKSLGKKIALPKPDNSISKFCIDLIKKCLEPDPKDRPSFEEILSQMRKNSYDLASDVNPLIISRRDKELEVIEKIQ